MKKKQIKKSKSSLETKTLWLASRWPANVQVAFVPNEKEWYRLLKQRYGIVDEEYPITDGRCTSFTKDGEINCLVTFSDKKTSKCQKIGLIAHEAAHCWQQIRNWMKEDNPSPEFEAYVVGGITQGLIECYERTRGKIT